MTTQVPMLLGRAQPSAVCRLIVAARIYAIDREVFGTRAHIREEGAEIIPPAIAYAHATRSVELVVTRRLHVATAFHAAPDRVLARVQVASIALARVATGAHRALFTSAAARVAAQQVLRHLHSAFAAVASTLPIRALLIWTRRARQRNEFAESPACQIRRNCGRHGLNYKAAAATVPADPRRTA